MSAPARPSPLQGVSLEDLLGGRVLAWVGGLAVLVGIVFLFAIGISRGWIDESARTLMGAAGALALLGAGVWLRERRERTDASIAATAAGIAGLFASTTVATQVYDLIPAVAGILLALVVGAVATVLAIRWNAQGIGALGIVGAVAAPVAVGAEPAIATLALLFIANASAVGVLLWRRWDWLAFAVFGFATAQWTLWLYDGDPSPAAIVLVLAAFGVLNAAAAVGFELRTRTLRLRIASHVLLALNAVVLAAAGAIALDHYAGGTAANGWLAGLALAHLAVGLVDGRRVSRELQLASLGIGVVLADVAFAAIADGLPLAIGWAATGAGFAALLARTTRVDGRRLARWITGRTPDAAAANYTFAALGLGGHIATALGHALIVDAPPTAIGETPDAAAIVALAAVAAGALVSARLARPYRLLLDGLGLAVIAYLGAIALEGVALTLFWAGQAAALAAIARRTPDHGGLTFMAGARAAIARSTDARLAALGALAFLAGALIHALATSAPPTALVEGLDDPLGAALALAGVTGAALLTARVAHPGALYAAAAATTLYLASTALVTPFQPGGDATGLPLAELDIRQQGQALLSGLWALVGVGALLAGLTQDRRALRIGALSLLGITIVKVFLFDLASLTSIYRVMSFVALGVLLLAAAFAWQRIRPRAPTPTPQM
jgi:uncharacterized membrane protein